MELKIVKRTGNGLSQCTLCKLRGRWSLEWDCMTYEIEGHDGVYCFSCINEIKQNNKLLT